MRKGFAFAALLTLVSGLPASGQDAVTLTEAEHAAWHAIGRVNVGGLNTRSSCTGALIASDLVLTAAHCVPLRAIREKTPEKVHFVAGWFRDTYAAHRTASQLYVHPEYAPGRYDGGHLYADVALIVLDEPITADEAAPLPLGPMPGFADDVEIVAYSNRRPGALARSGPCTAVSLNADLLGLTCPVLGGNSGAPVLRPDGDGWSIVAVTVAKNTSEGGFHSFAVRPAETLFELAGRSMP